MGRKLFTWGILRSLMLISHFFADSLPTCKIITFSGDTHFISYNIILRTKLIELGVHQRTICFRRNAKRNPNVLFKWRSHHNCFICVRFVLSIDQRVEFQSGSSQSCYRIVTFLMRPPGFNVSSNMVKLLSKYSSINLKFIFIFGTVFFLRIQRKSNFSKSWNEKQVGSCWICLTIPFTRTCFQP